MLKYLIGALGALLMLGALYLFAVEIGKAVQITSYKLVPWVFPVGIAILGIIAFSIYYNSRTINFSTFQLPLALWIVAGMLFSASLGFVGDDFLGLNDNAPPLVPSLMFWEELGRFIGSIITGAAGGIFGWWVVTRRKYKN